VIGLIAKPVAVIILTSEDAFTHRRSQPLTSVTHTTAPANKATRLKICCTVSKCQCILASLSETSHRSPAPSNKRTQAASHPLLAHHTKDLAPTTADPPYLRYHRTPALFLRILRWSWSMPYSRASAVGGLFEASGRIASMKRGSDRLTTRGRRCRRGRYGRNHGRRSRSSGSIRHWEGLSAIPLALE
jgi:hypothetical protein